MNGYKLFCWAVAVVWPFGLLRQALASAVGLPELRQAVAASKNAISTARILYVEESASNEPVEGNVASVEYNVKELNTSTVVEVSVLLDYPHKRAIAFETDLRDLNALTTENTLPPEQKVNLSRTKEVLYQGNYVLALFDAGVDGRRSLLLEDTGQTKWLLQEVPYLGLMDEKTLSDDHNPHLRAVTIDGRAALSVDVTLGTTTGTFHCDPAIGYRYRRIQWVRKGTLVTEAVADDYRDVNGIPYPFTYVERRFYPDGRLRNEKRYTIEEVAFGVRATDADFKIFVPAGTSFLETGVSMTNERLGMDRYIGIDQALAIGRNRLQNR